jgi:hypothetical protein
MQFYLGMWSPYITDIESNLLQLFFLKTANLGLHKLPKTKLLNAIFQKIAILCLGTHLKGTYCFSWNVRI